jgi:hypothetical protein
MALSTTASSADAVLGVGSIPQEPVYLRPIRLPSGLDSSAHLELVQRQVGFERGLDAQSAKHQQDLLARDKAIQARAFMAAETEVLASMKENLDPTSPNYEEASTPWREKAAQMPTVARTLASYDKRNEAFNTTLDKLGESLSKTDPARVDGFAVQGLMGRAEDYLRAGQSDKVRFMLFAAQRSALDYQNRQKAQFSGASARAYAEEKALDQSEQELLQKTIDIAAGIRKDVVSQHPSLQSNGLMEYLAGVNEVTQDVGVGNSKAALDSGLITKEQFDAIQASPADVISVQVLDNPVPRVKRDIVGAKLFEQNWWDTPGLFAGEGTGSKKLTGTGFGNYNPEESKLNIWDFISGEFNKDNKTANVDLGKARKFVEDMATAADNSDSSKAFVKKYLVTLGDTTGGSSRASKKDSDKNIAKKHQSLNDFLEGIWGEIKDVDKYFREGRKWYNTTRGAAERIHNRFKGPGEEERPATTQGAPDSNAYAEDLIIRSNQ